MLRYTLTTEGSSDRALLRHIDWLMEAHCGMEFNGQWADPASFSSQERDVATRIQEAVRGYPCDLLFVHRDADAVGRDARVNEIRVALEGLGITPPVVCLIPVRMLEAWLLIDEQAIRLAASNPRGRQPLGIPALRALEGLASPKDTLDEALIAASETTGRRRKQFRSGLASARYRVSSLINDLGPLRNLPGFAAFEAELKHQLRQNGWA